MLFRFFGILSLKKHCYNSAYQQSFRNLKKYWVGPGGRSTPFVTSYCAPLVYRLLFIQDFVTDLVSQIRVSYIHCDHGLRWDRVKNSVNIHAMAVTLFCKVVICCCLPRQPLGSFNTAATLTPSPHSFAITLIGHRHYKITNEYVQSYKLALLHWMTLPILNCSPPWRYSIWANTDLNSLRITAGRNQIIGSFRFDYEYEIHQAKRMQYAYAIPYWREKVVAVAHLSTKLWRNLVVLTTTFQKKRKLAFCCLPKICSIYIAFIRRK
jgi:hypothetical protein